MAKGGEVNSYKDSAKAEARPMPSETAKDASEVARNSAKKPLIDSLGTSNPTIKQAQKPSITRLSRPKMVGSDAFSVRDREDVDKDLMRPASEAPDDYGKEPRKRYDEEDAAASGPKVPDMQEEHNNSKAPYKKAIEDQYSEDVAEADMEQPKKYAAGGEVANDTEIKPDKGFGKIIIIDKEKKPMMAEGGSIEREEMMQPEAEAKEERHASIAAAIMAKRHAAAKLNSDSDMDEMVLMAEGGMVDIESNGREEPNAFYDRNKAILKENYDEGMEDAEQPMDSNEHGDAREDAESDPHDMVDKIMRKRKAK